LGLELGQHVAQGLLWVNVRHAYPQELFFSVSEHPAHRWVGMAELFRLQVGHEHSLWGACEQRLVPRF
jgi:hypothetical protein